MKLKLLKLIGVSLFTISMVYLVLLHVKTVELTTMERYRDYFPEMFASLLGMIGGAGLVSLPWE